VLADEGAIERSAVTLQTIRAWLEAHPGDADRIMNANPSYVFFRTLDSLDPNAGPLGSEGVPLTPGRSLAVDPIHVALGLPLWLDVDDPGEPGGRLNRLVVAQDTGGAIRGPVRGDVFWGFGPAARARAGEMRHTGGYYLLLPKAVAARRGG
jgi:membrane-bound lytic murein transglycosylase A